MTKWRQPVRVSTGFDTKESKNSEAAGKVRRHHVAFWREENTCRVTHMQEFFFRKKKREKEEKKEKTHEFVAMG
jgi:hypothetical protein